MRKWLCFVVLFMLIVCGCSQGTKSEPSKSAGDVTASDQNKEKSVDADAAQKEEPQVANVEDNTMNKAFTMDAFGYQTDEFDTKSGKKVAFHCIKHGSIRIQYDGLEFEIDPVIKLNDKTTDYAAFPDADYIFVTHEHFDHYDPEAIKALEKDGTVLITNQSCASKLGKGDVMANGDSRDLRDDIRLEAVPAYNTTPEHTKFHPKDRDNGFILTLDGFRIYLAGDTEDIPEMADIHDIDVAFLPCNQPYTMTVQQLVKAANVIQPKVLFPYHYGETSMDEVTAAMQNNTIDMRIRNYQ